MTFVNDAADQVNDLITLFSHFDPSKSLQTALGNKLTDVLTDLSGGQTATAGSALTDFIGHAQS